MCDDKLDLSLENGNKVRVDVFDAPPRIEKKIPLEATPQEVKMACFSPRLIQSLRQHLGITQKELAILPGTLCKNGYIESFNRKVRDELLDRKIFTTMFKAQVLIEKWRRDYNRIRPYSALGYRPPVPGAIMPSLTLSVVQ